MKTLIQQLTILLSIFFFLNVHHTKAQCHIDDWTVLKILYERTDGDNWKHNINWEEIKSNAPNANCNLEDLYGVDLNENGRVRRLDFTGNKLK